MAWNRPTAEELLGIKPEDLKSQLAAGKTAAEKAAAVETKLKEFQDSTALSLKAIQEGIQALKPVSTPAPGNNNNNGGGSGPQPDSVELPAWGEDAEAAYEIRKNRDLAPLVIGQLSLSMMQHLRDLRDTHPDFRVLESEIQEEIKKHPPAYYASYNGGINQAADDIYNLVKGRHHEEIVNDMNKKSGKYFIESGAGGSGVVHDDGGKDKNKGIQLNDAQRAAAKRGGLTEEEYKKYVEQIQGANYV